MQAVVERNRVETFAGMCHSHDFCDANVVIYELFLRHGVDPAAEGGRDHYGALWDQAWDLAKSRDFRISG
jgi:hypothetical protein